MSADHAIDAGTRLANQLPETIRVLVVEDNRLDYKVIARHLAQAFPDQVTTDVAMTIEAAKRRIAGGDLDFIMVDEGLGSESGLDLIAWLRQQADPPVALLVTGADTAALERRAIEAGAWQFISKHELAPGMLRRSLRFAWSQAWQEKALQLSRRTIADKEAFVSATLDAAFAGILTVSCAGHILLANRAARRLLGLEEPVVGQGWPAHAQLINPDGFALLPADAYPFVRMCAGDPPSNDIVLLKVPHERSLRHIRFSGQRVPWEGEDRVAVLLLQDVTDQEQNRERAERAGKLEALGQMTGGIAHDFNNILATILASAEIAQLLPEQTTESLATIVRSAKRGADLTNQLLTFARPAKRPSETVEVAAFLATIHELALRTMKSDSASPIEVALDAVDPSLALVCNPAELEHALLNLIINARDAIASHTAGSTPGHIKLSARPLTGQQIDAAGRLTGMPGTADANYVEITVSDNGPGMPEHVRRRAIEPFFTTKPLQAGSGLGLALVTSFVDKLGGTLRIYSDEGHGTTVRLMLPVADNAASMVFARKSHDAAPRGQGQRVLVVEDEDDLRHMTSALLRSLGYETITAANAPDAIELLDKGVEVDALLTDIIMPGGINGLELITRLEQRGFDRPIAIMSGYAGAEGPATNRPFIQKPCSHAEMASLMAGLFKD